MDVCLFHTILLNIYVMKSCLFGNVFFKGQYAVCKVIIDTSHRPVFEVDEPSSLSHA